MTKQSKTILAAGVLFAIACAAALTAGFFLLRPPRGAGLVKEELPRPGTEVYNEIVSAFYSGVAALDVDTRDRARNSLARATELAPQEPAAWANLGLLDLRTGELDEAEKSLTIAQKLAPESGPIERMLGLLGGLRGQYAGAVAHFRRAIALDPDDLKSRYSLIHEIERLSEPDSETQALAVSSDLVAKAPGNLAAILERARLAVKCVDRQALTDSVSRLATLAPSWPANAQPHFRTLEQEAKARPESAALHVVRLANVLRQTPAFRRDVTALETPLAAVGDPITAFLRLSPPAPSPSEPDETIAYEVRPVDAASSVRADSMLVMALTPEQTPALFAADSRAVRRLGTTTELTLPGNGASPPSPHSLLAVDWNSDYRIDLLFAGTGGLRFWLQKEDGSFADVTAASGIDAEHLSASYWGAWAADIDLDGDLDFVLGASAPAKFDVLRNNGDGKFTAIQAFAGAGAIRNFVWADLDRDGDPDAAILNSERTEKVYANERAGRFRLARSVGDNRSAYLALAVADVGNDGVTDMLSLIKGGAVFQTSLVGDERLRALATFSIGVDLADGLKRLFVADLDNNGALDLIVTGSTGTWAALGDNMKSFRIRELSRELHVFEVADVNSDGRLDLVGLARDGRPALGIGRGTKAYHHQVFRPRGAKVFGDGRINSFGLGGEIEVRAGLLVQKQVINGPVMHFGLGDRTKSDVARIIWPNGTSQVEFDTKADTELVAEQRLKGSCPFLFAFDGQAVRFVTDFIWRSPLGLRINAQATAGVGQTEDWVKIRGDQLKPREGFYDIRVTAELWETHYFDHMSLMVVDHRAGTEVFVDERFARTPPPLVVHATGLLIPVAAARDDKGRDVLDDVIARDGRYLDGFGRGQYQGITRDHWVEVELADQLPREGPLWLVAHGWIHPTDSSINVAIGQGSGPKPQGLVLEVPDAHGGWRAAQADLGFPSGKNKTILVDLSGLFPPGSSTRRLRLRTNLEIFWDSLAVAPAVPDASMNTSRLAAHSAELRLRGYSKMTPLSPSSPELPEYGSVTGTAQRWRDLIGFYTRFGDVRELLKAVDDRYVIANAGDELALRFPALPPPQEGWVRDFVMIGDGWNKDGDFNTAFSKTVLPLPSHARPGYDGPLVALEDDPVYRFHPEDWREYHTRYVTSSGFQDLLVPRAVNRESPRVGASR